MLRRSVRFRLSALAAVITACLVLVVGVVTVSLLRDQLTENLDESLSQRANTIERAISRVVPTTMTTEEDALVQLVGADGRVLMSSANLSGRAPIADQDPGFRTAGVAGRPETFRLLTRHLVAGERSRFLIVGVNFDDVTDPVGVLTRLLAIVAPLLVAGFAAVAWWLTGRALRPVESMRAEMAEISGSYPGRRVPESGTGDEIDRLAQTMNRTLVRLEDAITRQRKFVADASHELRGPLTSIRMALEVDLAHPGDARPLDTEQQVLEETIALQRLVDDLLHLARSDARAPVAVHEVVDLDDIVFREARRAAERGARTVDVSGVAAVQVVGDPSMLGRAIRNLIDNAERHAASTITLTLSDDGGHVRLTVTDDGRGVAPPDREHIFDRFARLDDARTRDAGGSGLGLAITRAIVEEHGGTVTLTDSQPTTFTIELPGAR